MARKAAPRGTNEAGEQSPTLGTKSKGLLDDDDDEDEVQPLDWTRLHGLPVKSSNSTNSSTPITPVSASNVDHHVTSQTQEANASLERQKDNTSAEMDKDTRSIQVTSSLSPDTDAFGPKSTVIQLVEESMRVFQETDPFSSLLKPSELPPLPCVEGPVKPAIAPRTSRKCLERVRKTTTDGRRAPPTLTRGLDPERVVGKNPCLLPATCYQCASAIFVHKFAVLARCPNCSEVTPATPSEPCT